MDDNTRTVHVYLGNDEGLYNEVVELVREHRDDDARDLAGTIQGWALDNMPDFGGGMYAELLKDALNSVDWGEIADSFREDADE